MADARLRVAIALLLLAGAAGCASAPPAGPPIPQVLEQVSRAGALKAGEVIEQTLKEQETFGYVAPFAPVVLPPEIRRIWVLTHVSPDGHLVSGHWVYMRLQDWRWFIEAEAASLRLGSVPAPAAIAPSTPAASSASPAAGGSARRSTQAPASLPWVEGSRSEGAAPQSTAGAGLEGGTVPTRPSPAPAPPRAPRPGGPLQ